MADEKPTTEATTTEPRGAGHRRGDHHRGDVRGDPSWPGAGPEGGPVPGDPRTEPVATAEQSHVAGRVGPPTIAQDQ